MIEDDVRRSHPYTLAGIRKLLGLTRHAILKLVELGFVEPARVAGRSYRFSFRDVVLLRSAHELRVAGVPTRSLLRSLRRLRDDVPTPGPAQGLRIAAAGNRLVVGRQGTHWEPDTGQIVLGFDVAREGEISVLQTKLPPETKGDATDDVRMLFDRAEHLEESDVEAAQSMYRDLLLKDPAHANAYLNLGFLLCKANRCDEALATFDAGLAQCPDDPLLHYNRAFALENLERWQEALSSYELCLRLQPGLADAHHNAALICARLGQKQRAIRHFNDFRKLQVTG